MNIYINLKKLNTRLFGTPDTFNLEQRVFNIITFYGTLLSVIALIGTVIHLDNMLYQITDVFVLIFFFIFYYLSRFKKKFYYLIFYFVIIVLLTLGWFFFGGATISVLYYYFTVFIVIWITENKQLRNILILLISLSLVCGLAYEYYFIETIKPVLKTKKEIFWEVSSSFITNIIFVLIVIKEVFNNYVEEKNSTIRLLDHMKHELIFARKIQQNMIPKKLPTGEQYKLNAMYKPMEEVGGDYYDFVSFPEESKLGIFISDVSGHGVPAALITTMLKTYIKTGGEKLKEPHVFLNYIKNNIQCQLSGYYLTAIYAIYDYANMKLYYSRAGHNPFYLVRNHTIIEPVIGGGIICTMNLPPYTSHSIDLESGDFLLFYTDGLVEAMDENRIMFEEKMLQLLKRETDENMIELLYNSLKAHHGSENFRDDICIITLELK